MTTADADPRHGSPVAVRVAVVLLVLWGLLAMLIGITAIVLRDNSFADLPVLLAETNGTVPGLDFRTEAWKVLVGVGIVEIVLGVIVVLLARRLGRGSRGAWLVVSAVLLLHVVVGLAVALTRGDYLRWFGLVGVVTAGVLLLLLQLPSSRRSFARASMESSALD